MTEQEQPHPQTERLYFVALYRTSAILGRMTRMDLPRIEATLAAKLGPNDETLDGWTYGTREQLLEQMGGQGWLTAEHFDQEDAHPSRQLEITIR